VKVVYVEVAKITGADYNPERRSTLAECKDLVASVKEIGILEPLRVTPGNVLIDGHRRLVAARANNLATVPVIVEARDPDVIYDAINSNRKQLSSNDKLHVYLKNPRAVDHRSRKRLESMERRVGRKQLALIAKAGGSLATMNQAVQLCRYMNKGDNYLPKCAVWLAQSGMTYQVRRAMEDGASPSVFARAIETRAPLMSKWEATA